jgi:phage-related protein
MRLSRPVTVSFLAALVLTFVPASVCVAQKNAPRPAARQAQPRAQNAKIPKANNRPGEQILRGLQNMTPEERQQALSKLPPARRAQIEKRLQNFENLPPAAQERRLDRLERLNSLEPRRQNQVRRSMRDLNALPDDRRKAVNQELRRMTNMSGEDREAHMNADGFRNTFSPSEQEMIGNLNELLPSKE